MKLIHCADLHLDAGMKSKLPPDKAKERRGELLTAFSRLAQAAADCEATAVIIAGDLFDSNAVTAKTKKFVLETIARYPATDFLLLPGNHDENTLDNFDVLPENLRIFKEGQNVFNYGAVCITGIINGISSATLDLDPERLNIAVLHGADGTDFKLKDLKSKNIDYLALGHYHSFDVKKLDRRGVLCYSGCLEGRGFDECGEKGYVLLEATDKAINYEFVPFSSRSVLEIQADLSDGDTLSSQRELIKSALVGVDKRNIVRLIITGTYELGREKFYDNIFAELEKEYFYLEICDRSVLKIDTSDYLNDVSLKGEFIRLCMREIADEAERSRVISCGIRALRAEEIE